MSQMAEESETTSSSANVDLPHVVKTEQLGNDGISEPSGLLCLNVQRYEGETREGLFHGEGVVFFKGDHIYKGMFSKGLMDGLGVFSQATGLKYKGEFVNNMAMGRGTYTWPDGSTYTGEIYRGIRHGTGTYKCAKSCVSYTGQWSQGKRHGKGTVYYNEDKTSWYKGDWVMNKREGYGERCYPSGNIYSGEWKNNLRHGEGTMNWLKLGQQYVGKWENGVQHGQGTHIWILKRKDDSQYSQSNHYKGDFCQGQRHGEGIFYYAGGAIYEGEWKNNRKHGQGKFTLKDGHVFQGEFMDDQMMIPNVNGIRGLPFGTFFQSDIDSSVLGPDMALSIECVLKKVPERNRDTEHKQVEFVVLQHIVQLRSIYSFYSRLGHSHSPDNTFQLYRLQFWRLLKDSNIHHHGVTLSQIDHFIREEASSADIHSPFTPMLFRKLLSSLVIVSYYIYSKDIVSNKNLLSTCLSKLMADNFLPNAKNVKGFLFRQPDLTVVAMKYMKRCWEIYQVFCSETHRDKMTMTYRRLLLMFKDLYLLDQKLTTAKLLEIIAAENSDPNNLSACLDLEITFLEFFEVLLGCVEVKCCQVSDAVEEERALHKCDSKARRDVPEVEANEKEMKTNSRYQSTGDNTDQDVVGAEDHEAPQSGEKTEEQGCQIKDVKTSGVETKYDEVKLRTQKIHQFFNHCFFPAVDHYQLVTREIEKKLLQEDQRCKKTQ